MPTSGGDGAALPATAAVEHNRPEPPHVTYAHALGEHRHAQWVAERMRAKRAKADRQAAELVDDAARALADAEARVEQTAAALNAAQAAAAGMLPPDLGELDPRRAAELEAETGIPADELAARADKARRARAKERAAQQRDEEG